MTSERDMNIRNLAEAIILQSVEDLWDAKQKGDCLTFFCGESFGMCAEIAGMTEYEQTMMLQLVSASAQEKGCNTIYPRSLKNHAYSLSGRR
jgi:predicted alpha-1,6-mannanase (GH76 family)